MLQLSFVNFRRGSYILVEGKPESDRFYIIQNGQAQVIRELDFSSTNSNNNILGPGDFVGVIPCMSNHNQIESVVALTDLVAISVRKDQYPDLIAKNTAVALKIIRVFAARMREMNEVLMEMALQSTSVVSTEQLFNVAVFYDKDHNIDAAVYAYYHYLKTAPQGNKAALAKQRFVLLQPKSRAVYLEPKEEMVRSYPQGTMVFAESQPGQDMYIIQEGQVKITKIVNNNEVVLAVLKKGDFFGEMALLENLPRSACAIAHEDCKLMVINRKNFDQMVSTQAQMITRLTTTLADRLWSMYRQVTNTRIQDPQGKIIDMIALQVEKARVPINPGVPVSHEIDLAFHELANKCAIPPEEQASLLALFEKDQKFKIYHNKIFVKNCEEVIKLATYYRKQKTTKK